MRKPQAPSSSMFEMQLMQQRLQQQQALQSEQAAYSAQLAQQNSAAASRVQQQQSQIDAGIKKQIARPVKLGTLLTSPNGLLGNPILSGSKLSG